MGNFNPDDNRRELREFLEQRQPNAGQDQQNAGQDQVESEEEESEEEAPDIIDDDLYAEILAEIEISDNQEAYEVFAAACARLKLLYDQLWNSTKEFYTDAFLLELSTGVMDVVRSFQAIPNVAQLPEMDLFYYKHLPKVVHAFGRLIDNAPVVDADPLMPDLLYHNYAHIVYRIGAGLYMLSLWNNNAFARLRGFVHGRYSGILRIIRNCRPLDTEIMWLYRVFPKFERLIGPEEVVCNPESDGSDSPFGSVYDMDIDEVDDDGEETTGLFNPKDNIYDPYYVSEDNEEMEWDGEEMGEYDELAAGPSDQPAAGPANDGGEQSNASAGPANDGGEQSNA